MQRRAILILLAVAALALVAFAGPVAAQPSGGVAAFSVQLSAKGNGALLTIELSGAVPHEISVLTGPDRLVIDLPKVAFATQPGKPGGGRAGPVSAFRYGLFFADRSRVVLDLSGPALVERVETTTDGRPRMLVHIVRVEPARFREAAARDSARRLAGTQPAPAPAPPAQSGLPMVVIDPGHGGIDPGASGNGGEPEKIIVLALAQAVEERLKSGGKVQVAMTRSDDTFIALGDRVRFARDRRAALMVSIHADTLAYEPGVRGASIYTLSDKASDALSQKLADSENKADLIAGVESREDQDVVGDILFDLTKRESRQFSLVFARQLVGALQDRTSIHKNPLRSAGFRVLKAPDVPSVLIEAGYLSSSEDAKLMKSAEWRATMAEAIATAIERYLGENATGAANSGARP